ncbi:hypothetical protein BvRS1_21780 [Burkholderia vietnamiensis]|nr:hypothetical protein BvRS1_21780 [Burkholderia vietnamiensis]
MLGSDTATTFVSSTISEHVADATASVAAAGAPAPPPERETEDMGETGDGCGIERSGTGSTTRMLGLPHIARH